MNLPGEMPTKLAANDQECLRCSRRTAVAEVNRLHLMEGPDVFGPLSTGALVRTALAVIASNLPNSRRMAGNRVTRRASTASAKARGQLIAFSLFETCGSGDGPRSFRGAPFDLVVVDGLGGPDHGPSSPSSTGKHWEDWETPPPARRGGRRWQGGRAWFPRAALVPTTMGRTRGVL